MSSLTFEGIDKSIRSISVEGMTAIPDTASRAQRLVAIYQGIHPILVSLSVLPLLPQPWRDALRLFLASFDVFAQSVPQADPDFKAGKDL